jgi:hypothetical protein
MMSVEYHACKRGGLSVSGWRQVDTLVDSLWRRLALRRRPRILLSVRFQRARQSDAKHLMRSSKVLCTGTLISFFSVSSPPNFNTGRYDFGKSKGQHTKSRREERL